MLAKAVFSRWKWIVALGVGALLALSQPATAADRRPLIAILANNSGTETTDFIVPFGVLTASGAADVIDVAVHDGPVTLMPALAVLPHTTLASFDAAHPEGADYVIVPAMHDSDDPSVHAWLQRQAAQHATIVGICDGVWVVGNAGLLDGHAATGHWFSRAKLARRFPTTRWVDDRRYVEDDRLITTTGVTASLPVSLRLVEKIAGRERAEAVAQEFGALSWGTEHKSSAFQLSATNVITAAANLLRVWAWETRWVRIAPGADEVSLALSADALARTYRTSIYGVADDATVVSKRGLRIVTTRTSAMSPGAEILVPSEVPATESLERALATIRATYGENTARFVALQIEYPWNEGASATPRR